MDKLAKEVL